MDWNVTERSEHLGAAPYERRASRVGYANGFEDKTAYDVESKPSARDLERYPASVMGASESLARKSAP